MIIFISLLAFFFLLIVIIASILNKFYIISNIGNSNCYYQLIDANTLELYINSSNIEERDYLDITFISFILFLFYISCVKHKTSKNFFDTYFMKHYKTIVY